MPKSSRKRMVKRRRGSSKTPRRARRARRASRTRIGRSLHGFVEHHFKDRNPFCYPYQASQTVTQNDTWPSLATLPTAFNNLGQATANDVLFAFLPSLQESTVYNQQRPYYQFVKLNKVVLRFKALMQQSSTGSSVNQAGFAITATSKTYTPYNLPSSTSGTSAVLPSQFRTVSGIIDMPGVKKHELGKSFSLVIRPRLTQLFTGVNPQGTTPAVYQWIANRKFEIAGTLGQGIDVLRYGVGIFAVQAGTAGSLQFWDMETRYEFTMYAPY